jgi:hypothetical protein
MALGAVVILTACGGGGGSGSSSTSSAVFSIPTATSAPTIAPQGNAVVSITIPTATTQSSRRSPRYVSTATNSMTVVANGGSTTVIALTSSSPGCTAVSGGRNCTVQLSLPVGSNVPLTVRTFASTDGTGNALSIADVSATIVANQNNAIDLTLNPVVKSIAMTIASPFTTGIAGSANVTVNVLDAASQIIVVGPNNLVDQNDSPVTVGLSDSDASGVTRMNASVLGAAAVSVAYSGGTPPAAASLSAVARNAANATVASTTVPIAFSTTPAPTPTPSSTATASPSPIPTVAANPASLSFLNTGGSFAQSISVTQSGYAGPFTATTSGGATSAVSTSVSGNIITVTPQQPGTTNVIVTGGYGQSIAVPVSVTSTSVSVQ